MSPVPASPAEVAGITNLNGKAVVILDIGALVCGEAGVPDGGGALITDAIIFKPSPLGDRMGFAFEKPCDLIEPDGVQDSHAALNHVTGIAEFNGIRYKIISAESVFGRFGGKHDV